MAEIRENSPSPSRRTSFGTKISAIGAKISRSLSSPGAGNGGSDQDSIASTLAQEKNQDRSLSRGREAFHSSGRGGIGNIRQASASREARPTDGPDDFSSSRGREPLVDTAKVFSTGRGGAGNIRSPSRDVHNSPLGPDPVEEEVIRKHIAETQDGPHSSGRGGAGNISRSRSRGPTSSLNQNSVHSTGRGGAGNLTASDGVNADTLDEAERRGLAHPSHDAIHSTGRGGTANLTSFHEPTIERPAHVHTEYHSTGRGGAGNIVHEDA